MIQIQENLRLALADVLADMAPGTEMPAVLEKPKLAEHGDFAITAAMPLARTLKQSPRQLAQTLKDLLQKKSVFIQHVSQIEIAGPGFLNLRLNPSAKQEVIAEILQAGPNFGMRPATGQRVMVEFVSANPTGPLHVGHGRQAALGDAICNLLVSQGHQIHREFYYNDGGGQIDSLARSVQCRARQLAPGAPEWPEGGYHGEYVIDIARDFMAGLSVCADDREFTASADLDDLAGMRQFAVAYLRREQDLDLQAFSVKFDEYYLESSLYTTGRVEQTVQRLIASGKTYQREGALWLRSTDYGDDKDRVMRKSDGSYTYFLPDVAYHISKWERGFTRVVNIQGADHHGTMARVRAGLQASGVGIPEGYPDYVLHTMVRVMRGGQEVKISKRAGSYVTLRDLIDWTGKDAVRFFLLSRKPDTEYVFDVDLAQRKNNENPVYYVQYAHARICSVLSKEKDAAMTLTQADLRSLDSPLAQSLMMELARYPDMLRLAAADFAPHDVTFYLRDVASAYHRYYDSERILVEDPELRRARLALVAATAQVLRNGLAILGVSAPEHM